METKRFSQRGTTTVVILLGSLLLFIAFLLAFHSPKELHNYVIAPVVVIIAVTLLLMYKLDIIVSDDKVAFKFGVGLFGKEYKLSEIKSCKPVTSSIFWGYGIRWIPNGWLYNVSGTKAIELEFYNRNSIVRIGTDKPEEVSELIQSQINANPNSERLAEYKTNQNILHTLILFVFFGLLAYIFYSEFIDTKTKLNNDNFEIEGMYGFNIPYTSIATLDTLTSLPEVSYRSHGLGGFGTSLGNFVMADGTSAKLFIRKGSVPYLKITTRDRLVIYLNHRDSKKTFALYQELKAKLE